MDLESGRESDEPTEELEESSPEETEEVKRIHKVVNWAKNHPWLAGIAGLGTFLPLAAIVWNMAILPLWNIGENIYGTVKNYPQMQEDIKTNKENNMMFGAMIAGEMDEIDVDTDVGIKFLYMSNTGDLWYRRECDGHWFSAMYLAALDQHYYVDFEGKKLECWNDKHACKKKDKDQEEDSD